MIGKTDITAAAAPIWTKHGFEYRSRDELAMRDAVERWGRAKWPGARQVHELVMGRGETRADMAIIGTDHFVSVEIKSQHDGTGRLLNQVGMFRLASPELWVVVCGRHKKAADLMRYLVPSLGIAITTPDRDHGNLPESMEVVEVAQPEPWQPHPASMLNLLWVDELMSEAKRYRVVQGNPKLSHKALVERMLRLGPAEQIEAVCRQLRGRLAFWRADPLCPYS